MSSRRPVSFHQPRTMCGSTRIPPSTRCWIASVISSSPRAEGSIARAASWIPAVNMYTPTSARSVAGSAGFSTSLTTRPTAPGSTRLNRSASSATPKFSGSGTGVSRISASGSCSRKASTRSEIPPCSRLSPRYITNGLFAKERLGGQHRMRQPRRLVLHDVRDLHPEPRAVAGGLADLLPGLRRDDDPDLLDPRRRHRLDPVEQHRLVRYRHKLLRARMRDRAQARALTTRENQTL